MEFKDWLFSNCKCQIHQLKNWCCFYFTGWFLTTEPREPLLFRFGYSSFSTYMRALLYSLSKLIVFALCSAPGNINPSICIKTRYSVGPMFSITSSHRHPINYPPPAGISTRVCEYGAKFPKKCQDTNCHCVLQPLHVQSSSFDKNYLQGS